MWFVYILQCSDEKQSLYTGSTNDLDKRIKKHNDGAGAKYTRGRRPVKLVRSIEVVSKSEALKLEYKIKRLPKARKLTYEQ